MHKNAMKCNKTLSKWYKNKHGASKIIDTFETYQGTPLNHCRGKAFELYNVAIVGFCVGLALLSNSKTFSNPFLIIEMRQTFPALKQICQVMQHK
jgi:hypothetical protein